MPECSKSKRNAKKQISWENILKKRSTFILRNTLSDIDPMWDDDSKIATGWSSSLVTSMRCWSVESAFPIQRPQEATYARGLSFVKRTVYCSHRTSWWTSERVKVKRTLLIFMDSLIDALEIENYAGTINDKISKGK